jgi:hypothetical protein
VVGPQSDLLFPLHVQRFHRDEPLANLHVQLDPHKHLPWLERFEDKILGTSGESEEAEIIIGGSGEKDHGPNTSPGHCGSTRVGPDR